MNVANSPHFRPFKVIGIGATFSPNLTANLSEAARLSLFFDAKLVVIHVGEASPDKRQQFEAILSPFVAQGLCFECIFMPGKPVAVILHTTEALKIDLLIIGALQRENVLNYYLGSIARKVSRSVKCHILLLIKPSIKRVACNHIVVNGLENPKTEQSIHIACYVGAQLGASKMTIVEEIRHQEIHVNVKDDTSLRRATIVREKLRRREDSRVQNIVNAIPKTMKSQMSINTQSIFGKRGYSIGHYAEMARADLLVMNAHSKTRFWDRLFPHDIEHILTELPTDVLILQ
ncbi:MAG: universal stress protein UspA [Cytophagaceae bacterium]|nr:universal stress protein UspA [Cytophagaceae bacterium]